MFSDLTKTLTFAFWWTFLKWVFQTFRHYNLAWGQAIHTRFNDLDTISRSHACQNHKLHFLFLFLFLILVHCSLHSILLLHTLKRPSAVCFV